MKNLFRTALFAALSLLCVVLAYLFFGAFVVTGTNRLLGSSMVHVGQFAILCPCLIAIVLALASVIWNRRKIPGLIALVVAVVGTWALYRMGG
ncbi:MAG TPA: hypothetical protein VL990_18115 [Acidobacteriaceae bacterium]|nr:hypothetical protein [Acidobacteriaceae bacterium]